MKNSYIFLFSLLFSACSYAMESPLEENSLVRWYKEKITTYFNTWEKGNKIDLRELITEGIELGFSKKQIAEILKTIQNNNGDTFTHIIVKYGTHTDLVNCARTGIISLKKNKHGFTALDLISVKFTILLKHKNTRLSDLEKLQCSRFILENYLKLKQNPNACCGWYCEHCFLR